MNDEMSERLDRLKRSPFPDLGKAAGDFALYDGLIAGLAHNAASGNVTSDPVPEPDKETLAVVGRLRAVANPTADERAFLDYYDNLAALRELVVALRGRDGDL